MKTEKEYLGFRIEKSRVDDLTRESQDRKMTLSDMSREALEMYLEIHQETRKRIRDFADQIKQTPGRTLEVIFLDYIAKLNIEIGLGKTRDLSEFMPRANGAFSGDDLYKIFVMHWQNESIGNHQ